MTSLSRRNFLALVASAGALALAGCGNDKPATSEDANGDAAATGSTDATDLAGASLTFVGDDAFAPFRSLQVAADGTTKLQGLDIDIMDEMARRLGFTYTFEAQDFAATLASVQASQTSFTMPMSANDERRQTFDFTSGYYQPLVGVLTTGEKIETLDGLAGKSVSCTTGTVQNKFVEAAVEGADIHTYDGGDQCLQEVLAGRVDAYVCDGAEGVAMQAANPDTVLGLLPREDTSDYVSVYRIMAAKGASFIADFDAAVAEMLEDGTIDGFIEKWVGPEFVWGADAEAAAKAE